MIALQREGDRRVAVYGEGDTGEAAAEQCRLNAGGIATR